MVSLISSLSGSLSSAAAFVAQSNLGPYLLQAATHWQMPAGAFVGYVINTSPSLRKHVKSVQIAAFCSLYLLRLSGFAGLIIGAHLAGRLFDPYTLVGLYAIDFLGKASLHAMASSIGALTIGQPVLVRAAFSALAFYSLRHYQSHSTHLATALTLALGLLILYYMTGTTGLFVIATLHYLHSDAVIEMRHSQAVEKPKNFSCRFDPIGVFNAAIGGVTTVSDLDEGRAKLEQLINHHSWSEAKTLILKIASQIAFITKATRINLNEDSTHSAYNKWYKAVALATHPDKQPGRDDTLFKVVNQWKTAVDTLQENGFIKTRAKR